MVVGSNFTKDINTYVISVFVLSYVGVSLMVKMYPLGVLPNIHAGFISSDVISEFNPARIMC
jgi:hypothetical protein